MDISNFCQNLSVIINFPFNFCSHLPFFKFIEVVKLQVGNHIPQDPSGPTFIKRIEMNYRKSDIFPKNKHGHFPIFHSIKFVFIRLNM